MKEEQERRKKAAEDEHFEGEQESARVFSYVLPEFFKNTSV